MKGKTKEIHAFLLRLDKQLIKPIMKIADKNKRSANDEINIAVEIHIEKNRDKLK